MQSFILKLLLLFASGLAIGANSSRGIPEAINLQAEAVTAKDRHLPILLMVSQIHCPFCDQMKRDILEPMLISGDYENKVIIREIFIDLNKDVTDFTGQRVDARAFAHAYGVWLTPTLLLLAPDGKELSQRLIGLTTPEMFSYYVDQAIDKAAENLANGHYLPPNKAAMQPQPTEAYTDF